MGERYRDLIQAADSIAEMKITSEKIENVIKLKEFNNRNIILPTDQERKQIQPNGNVIVQLKVLTNLIEMISTSIDENDFLKATQLYLLSLCVSSGLKFDSNNELLQKFPVALKQWNLLTTFRSIIKQRCYNSLEEKCITIENTVKCLASLLLLENGHHLDKLLETFIQIRTKTFVSIIESITYPIVKDKILESIIELVNTVSIVYECFVRHEASENSGLLFDELKILPPTFDYVLKNQKSSIFKTLPDIILKYKPQVQVIPLGEDAVKHRMGTWINSIENISKGQLKVLIKCIVSINTIRDIKNMINGIVKPKNWSLMCSTLFQQNNLDFYHEFYQPLMLDRIHNIIKISWTNIQSEFSTELDKLISINERVHRDMKYYIWTNDESDNPISLKDALSSNKRSHSLLMKVNGYNKHIVDICNKIDNNLEQILNDLKKYLFAASHVKELVKMDEIDKTDQEKIVKFLRECSKKNIVGLIAYTRTSASMKDPENIHLIARLLQSITEICPNLEQCLSGNLTNESPFLLYDSRDANPDAKWNEIVCMLSEESIKYWNIWLSEFVNQWSASESEVDLDMLIRKFSTWEGITIEEKDENDEMIKSQIFVPQQLSITIQCWIFNIISNLNRIIPHTLPKSIHLKIVDEVIQKLLQHYEQVSKHTQTPSNQKLAWQCFYDLKVLGTLFVRRENKLVNENLQQLVNAYRSMIDPFDFDVFYPFVSINVKKNVARLQYDMGCLIPNMEFLNGILSNVNLSCTQDNEPNIMPMSTLLFEKSWFPLLPIVKSRDISVIQEVDKDKLKVGVTMLLFKFIYLILLILTYSNYQELSRKNQQCTFQHQHRHYRPFKIGLNKS